jgi:hypothetical protein
MADEGRDLPLQITGQEVVLQQDTVLRNRSIGTACLTLGR